VSLPRYEGAFVPWRWNPGKRRQGAKALIAPLRQKLRTPIRT
jgi:hypothetical protein